jgi:hypothetical protein
LIGSDPLNSQELNLQELNLQELNLQEQCASERRRSSMAFKKMRQRGNDPATRRSPGSLPVAALVAVALVAGWTSAANARGGWHGFAHVGAGAEAHGGERGGGRRHGNDSYMKAASAERDKLLNNKLKSICRGC